MRDKPKTIWIDLVPIERDGQGMAFVTANTKSKRYCTRYDLHRDNSELVVGLKSELDLVEIKYAGSTLAIRLRAAIAALEREQ